MGAWDCLDKKKNIVSMSFLEPYVSLASSVIRFLIFLLMSFWFFVSQKFFNLESKVNKLRNQFKSKEKYLKKQKKKMI